MSENYPCGHPFWLIKPSRQDFDGGDYHLLLLDLFQGGRCFLNGISGNTCHPDSYMTILDYNAVDVVFKIIQDEFSLPKEKWNEFCDLWINHPNKQPVTCLLGFHIKGKLETL